LIEVYKTRVGRTRVANKMLEWLRFLIGEERTRMDRIRVAIKM